MTGRRRSRLASRRPGDARGGSWLAALVTCVACAGPFARPFAIHALQPALWAQTPPPAAVPLSERNAPPPCDANSPLILLAVDTTTGQALVAAGEDGAAWLRITGDTVSSVRKPAAVRLAGGFVGAGPLAVVANCGAECLQPYRIGAIAKPFGDAILAPRAAAVSATYDGSGTAWVAAVRPTASAGFWRVAAFRHEASGDWVAKGQLTVSDLEGAGLVPVPDLPDSVAIGTGLFGPAGPAGYWVDGKPRLSGASAAPGADANEESPAGGQILPLGGARGAYVGLGGEVFFTGDRGGTWSRSLWTPWGSGFVQAWRLGEHYSVELPAGAMSPLPLLWLDRRHAERPGLSLSSAMPGDWRLLAAIAGDESFPAEVAAAWVDTRGNWSLLAGCEKNAGGSALRLRRWREGTLEPAISLPID